MVFLWIGGIVLGNKLLTSERDFRGEIETILQQISDENAADIYNNSSPIFRDSIMRSRFVDLTKKINRTMGKFENITEVIDSDSVKTRFGKTSAIETMVKFEKGETQVSFSFIENKKTWKLLHFWISIPKERIPVYENVQAQTDPRAPKKVIKNVSTLLTEIYKKKEGAKVYSEAAKILQDSLTEKDFLTLFSEREELMGKYKRVLDVPKSFTNKRGNKCYVKVLLEYEKGNTLANFHFLMVDSTWKLLHSKIMLPLPKVKTVFGQATR